MLARRLQSLVSAGERAALVRLYFASCRVQSNQSNLQSSHRQCKSSSMIDGGISLINIRSPGVVCQRRWLNDARVGSQTNNEDDDSTAEQRSENGYARSVMSRTERSMETIAHPLEKISSVTDEQAESILLSQHHWTTPDTVVEAFEKLSYNAKVSGKSLDDSKHTEILFALGSQLPKMSDQQLHLICQCFLLWQNIAWERSLAYANFCRVLDNECIARLNKWTVEKALLMCDYLYLLRLVRKCSLTRHVLRKLGNKPNSMSTSNFLHFMFLLNVCRKPHINMYEIEYRFDSLIDKMSADELGIVAMGFFKTQTSLRDDKLLSKIHKKVLEKIDTIQDISFSAIMKITRYSMGLKDLSNLRKILQGVKSRVQHLSLPCLVHVLHAAAYVQCYDAQLLQLIVERFVKDTDKARLKDLERLSWALSIFNYDSEAPVYKKIVSSLRDKNRAEEIERYPTIVPTTLLHLSNAGIFPVDLIEQHLEPKFLERLFGNNPYRIGWDYLALESNVRTELPEYKGPFLQKSIRHFLAKKYLKDLMAAKSSQVHPSDRLILEVAHVCKLLLECDNAIHIDHVLPHFMKPDIIICLDDKNNPIAPQPILSEIPLGTIKRPPPSDNNNLKWIALVLATQNQMIRESDRYIGPLITKVRQLGKLGYQPIVVPYTVWGQLPNLEAKRKYLGKILLLPLSSPDADAQLSAEAI